ncbi:uncharacterized protein LOC114282608 [Camellia sinensis]|uniref:uncharacterized protein LOC114282608 n=1 Tax=Camellia sinensis TaxID=4442 RepID=UPI001036D99F|nr:uncharacterized protein LOC114282608 [Camellia sinensis]
MAPAVGQEGSSQDSTAASLASQLLSAIKSIGLWVVSYFTYGPANHKDHYSGSKVEFDDVESAGDDRLTNSPTAISTTSSQTHPSHPISIASQQPGFKSESQTQTRLSNPIAKAFHELEMGKLFLTFILPTTTMILALHGKDSSSGVLHSILCLLCTSLVALLYGISFRDLFPGIANTFEPLGTAFEKPHPPKSKNRETFEGGDDGALTYLTPRGGRRWRTHISHSNSNSKIPKSPILHRRSKGRTKHLQTRKPANQSSRRCGVHHFRLDSSLVINLNTSDITGGLETSQQLGGDLGARKRKCLML